MSNVPAPFASSFPPPGREKCDMQDRICAEVRLPPMYPKDAVWPKRLAAGLDSLYMAPAAAGYAMTQWAHAEKKLSIPEGTATASTEDADAAPSGAVPNPEGLDESITCFLVDERSCSMWTGHKGGAVACWTMSEGKPVKPKPGSWQANAMVDVTRVAQLLAGHVSRKSRKTRTGALASQRHGHKGGAVARWTMSQGKAVKPEPGRWQANGMGDVCCMTLSKSGELWVGSEFGTLRVWSYPGGTPARKNDIYVLAEREQNWIHVDKDLDPHLAHAPDSSRISTGLDPRLAHAPQSSRLFHLDPVYQQQHQQSDADEPSTQRALGTSMMRGINVMGKFAAKVTKAVKQNMAPQLEAAQGDASYTEGKGEDGGSSEKGNPRGLIPIPDGTMVVGFKYGLIEKFTELGRFIGAFDLRTGIKCMSLVAGQWLWVGCRDGHISVLDIVSGKLLRTWPAALFPIISLTAVGSVVYSLSKDGSVKGWPLTQPSEEHAIMWTDGLQKSLHRHDLRVVAGTWNVNCSRPSLHSLQTWLGARCQEADIVVVGLQEVEMGTGSVAQNAAIRVLYSSLLDKGNQNAQWWTMQLDVVLGVDRFVRVALRQMSGILVLVFAHKDLAAHVGEVSSTSVACGVLGLGGNKGAVAVSMSVFRRRMVVLCSHFAAHQDKVEERNADYTKIVRSLHFDNNPAHYHSRNNNQAGEESGNQIVRNPTMVGSTVGQVPSTTSNGNIGQQQTPRSLTHASAAVGPGLLDAEMLAWVGDFNYRIDGQYNFVVDCANHGLLTDLAALDQLRNEMAKGNIFHGLSEGPLAFPPTYKFDKGVETSQEGLLPYDSSEKRRVPAWTDRILWHDHLDEDVVGPLHGDNTFNAVIEIYDHLDEDVVVSFHGDNAYNAVVEIYDHLDEDVVVSLHGDNAYNAVVEICESDHKPLVASLQNMKRSHSLAVLSSISDSAPSHAQPTPSDAAPPGPPPIKHPTLVFDPATLVAPSTASPPRTPCIVALATPGAPYRLCISPGEQFPLVVSNSGTRTCEAAFAGASNGTQPWLPPWLQITPASFVIEPGSCKQVVFRVLPLEGAPPQRYSFVCELCTQAVADVRPPGPPPGSAVRPPWAFQISSWRWAQTSTSNSSKQFSSSQFKRSKQGADYDTSPLSLLFSNLSLWQGGRMSDRPYHRAALLVRSLNLAAGGSALGKL
eukprot:gene24022-9597_t